MENIDVGEKMDDEGQEKNTSPVVSDSEDDLSNDEEVLEEEIQQKEKAVERSPYNYDLHIQLINLLRKHGDLEQLRKSREKMNEIFPLSPELWLEWLSDESKLAVDTESRQTVTDLFNRAVKDYNSVEVWLEFCQFSIGKLDEPDGTQAIRKIYETAITAVGIHFKMGSLVWEAYREFENAVLSMMKPAPGNIPNPEDQTLIDEQIKKISSIFQRHLSIPHQNMEHTYKEYAEWETDEIGDNFRFSYESALKKMKDRSTFEDNLESSEKPHWNEYLDYIKFEEKEGEPARIQSIYERAITDNCLIPDLWSKYCNYIDKKLKISDISLPLHERSVRNCPWSVNLWIIYIQAFERYKKPRKLGQSVFDRALQAGFSNADEYRQLWLAFLEFCARQIDWSKKEEDPHISSLRKLFQKAIDYLSENYSKEGDPYCTIQQYWARLEARHLSNMERSRKLWTDIMSQGNGKYAQMWVEYYNLERSFGDSDHERKILQMGVQCASDSPETIVEMFLAFEKDVGTIEQLDAACSRCETQMCRVEDRRAKAAEKEVDRRKSAIEQRKQVKLSKNQNKSAEFEKKKKEFNFTEEGRRIPREKQSSRFKEPSIPISKNARAIRGPHFVRESEIVPAENKFKEPLEPSLKGRSVKRPPPGFEKQISKHEPEFKKPKIESSSSKDSENIRDPSSDDRTVFLSNLAFSLEEGVITDIFKSVGTVIDLRIMKGFRGQSKGYGYLEFEKQSEAEEALKKDRHVINGRPMYVSRCKSNKQGAKKFQYDTSLDKSKIFVKGFNYESTKEDLEDHFKQFGKLKDVRLVTYKSGKSKGLAFIEYEEEASATAAVLKADGVMFQDRQITVAISNPPSRKDQQNAHSEPSTSKKFLGHATTFGSRGRGRTNLPMVPRSVPLKGSSAKSTKNGSESDSKEPPAKLSNADFRNMLLKK